MKILHLSRSDMGGGAARGAYWLHNALQQAGIDSNMLVATKSSEDARVTGSSGTISKLLYELRFKLDLLPLSIFYKQNRDFSISWVPSNITSQIQKINPDIINIHWLGWGFVQLEELAKFNKPIVWTLRDMWTFTGGCHYSGDCVKYAEKCGACPVLKSQKENDISRQGWYRKEKIWKKLNLTIAPLSHWLADCARESSLLKNTKIQVIPNALDPAKFKPLPKLLAKKVLGLDPDKKIIAFGAVYATEKRKGFQYLVPALQKLAANGLGDSPYGDSFASRAELVVFGSSKPQEEPDLGMKATYLGRLNDDISLAIVYAAADVMVVPSVQEAFGKTAMEALACGTPVVSFDSTGLKDIVEHMQNGYRAECFSVEDLARGINWVLEDEERWQALSHRAREKVEQEFTLEVQARAYKKLYEEVLESSR